MGSQRRTHLQADRIEGSTSLLFLPAYSPEFNPIEGVFSKLKNSLQGSESQETKEMLLEAM
ncbi:MAG: transposase [Rubrobacter sp.]|nr:transposase [Rubrobacter sp.]